MDPVGLYVVEKLLDTIVSPALTTICEKILGPKIEAEENLRHLPHLVEL